MIIQLASKQDSEDIRNVHLSSFPEGEGDIIADLAVHMLCEETHPPVISLIAKCDGQIVGNIVYSPVTININQNWQGYILAPLAILPNYQKRHIGSQLIMHGIKMLTEMGVNSLFVYGDPKYYGRFGFNANIASQYVAPYKLQYPTGWQAVILNEFNISNASIEISCVEALCKPNLW